MASFSEPMPNPLTNETFDDCIRTHPAVVVHFWAAWNHVDLLMLRRLQSEVPDAVRWRITFASVDTDVQANFSLCERHHVKQLPFLSFYREGVLVRSITGLATSEVITAQMKELLGEHTADAS
jgi:thioredoxin-like negative regulator of GroEL